jgi:hypothetical protein
MRTRPAAAVAVALAVVSTGAAHAATKKPAKPKPVCNIIKDGTKDTFAARPQDTRPELHGTGPQEDGFDITSADIASDGKWITAVVRVKKLSSAIQTSPTGAGFGVDFQLPSSDLVGSLRAVLVTGQQPYFEATSRDPEVANTPSTYLGAAKGLVVTKKNEVHITAPVSVFASLGQIKKGTLISFPEADAAATGRAIPPSPGVKDRPVASRFVFADVAPAGKPYKVGTASCVVHVK